MEVSATFTGFHFLLKTRKTSHLMFSACSTPWPAQWSTSQVTGNYQTIWPQGSCLLTIAAKYWFSFYLQGLGEGKNQDANSPANYIERFAWVPPAHCHISHPSQLGPELVGLSEGKDPLNFGDRGKIPPFFFGSGWRLQSSTSLSLFVFVLPVICGISGWWLSRKICKKYLMSSGWSWKNGNKITCPADIFPVNSMTNNLQPSDGKFSPVSLNPKLACGFFWSLACWAHTYGSCIRSQSISSTCVPALMAG